MTRDDRPKERLRALGDSGDRNRSLYTFDFPDPAKLETMKAPPSCNKVVLRSINWTGLCPITGQPDHGELQIEYQPRTWILESKSLKLYLMGFRNHGLFGEHVVDRVLKDIDQRLRPEWIRVYGVFALRGDISVEAESYRGPEVVITYSDGC